MLCGDSSLLSLVIGFLQAPREKQLEPRDSPTIISFSVLQQPLKVANFPCTAKQQENKCFRTESFLRRIVAISFPWSIWCCPEYRSNWGCVFIWFFLSRFNCSQTPSPMPQMALEHVSAAGWRFNDLLARLGRFQNKQKQYFCYHSLWNRPSQLAVHGDLLKGSTWFSYEVILTSDEVHVVLNNVIWTVTIHFVTGQWNN